MLVSADDKGLIILWDLLQKSSVSKLGSSIIITIKMVDVATGKIEGSRSMQCNQCELEELPEGVNYLMKVLIEI